ncbi:hypothetical protein IAE22_33700, partial [Bacillus sp. S34]|nr:hypothetical protein [Bacillus sp. S34]
LNWCASPFGTEAWTYRKFGIEGRDFEYRDGAPVLTKTGNSETGLGEFPLQYFTEAAVASGVAVPWLLAAQQLLAEQIELLGDGPVDDREHVRAEVFLQLRV